jgi:2-amino-4-hydroxy-6-hydroxymethyldihydropteridine diphosphokinase
MPQAVLSLGSNMDPAVNIRMALRHLQRHYGRLLVSPVYESEAVGFSGDNFLNLVVAMQVDCSLPQLAGALKALEQQQGRDRSGGSFAARTLDVDILTFDNLQGEHAGMLLPREEITRYAFVLRPLADLLPTDVHPTLGQTYRALWSAMQSRLGDSQRLWPVPFAWQESHG